MKVFCVGIAGRAMTEKLADVLFYNAHDMIESGKEKQRIRGRDYDGKIKTTFERCSLASISGVLFSAKVMTPKGETQVNYLVRDQDLDGIEKANWKIYNHRSLEEKKNVG